VFRPRPWRGTTIPLAADHARRSSKVKRSRPRHLHHEQLTRYDGKEKTFLPVLAYRRLPSIHFAKALELQPCNTLDASPPVGATRKNAPGGVYGSSTGHSAGTRQLITCSSSNSGRVARTRAGLPTLVPTTRSRAGHNHSNRGQGISHRSKGDSCRLLPISGAWISEEVRIGIFAAARSGRHPSRRVSPASGREVFSRRAHSKVCTCA
jgi:hypothetical protein